ncbi:hypothetical protein [Micromonospora sp. WMMD812]|uniref:hypothetical protein n=1 Tax=Micromonospora sp. WMMD812 TaxID=3015152 RepID=UPI00248AE61D|nr:hypothetical protein [Micromonospora sp. WMMD812]WBB68449.1 hypothetical protein O7603_03450 [Micromonospora sp. WMMD812]
MKSTLDDGTVAPDLSWIARERAALVTIADAIAAASVGKGQRVAVACPNSHLGVVDHLAQALHARGRACRCLLTEPNLVDGGDPPPERRTGSSVVVITSGLLTETDRGMKRVTIAVTAGPPNGGRWRIWPTAHERGALRIGRRARHPPRLPRPGRASDPLHGAPPVNGPPTVGNADALPARCPTQRPGHAHDVAAVGQPPQRSAGSTWSRQECRGS